MDALPDHLLYEILLLTPCKSLLRFRSLSRQWRDIISSHKFVMDHLKLHKKRKSSHYVISCSYSAPSITLYPDSGEPFKLDLPFSCTHHWDEFIIRSSCHGLLCVTFWTAASSRSDFLWNPITREYTELPAVSAETSNIALGFDPTTNDYKIVVMAQTLDIQNRKIIVQTVKSNVCRKVEDRTQYMPVHRSVAIDGCIFWLATGLQNSYAVLKFDLASDHLTGIPCPPQATVIKSKHDQIRLSLHECGGSVQLVRFELEDAIQWSMKIIWLLSTADGSWRDISSRYKSAVHKSFRGWDGPLGFTSEAAVVIDRAHRNYVCKDNGLEMRGVRSSLKDCHYHLLHCESLVSPSDAIGVTRNSKR
ncbi:unnamed protein product [Rhodiola kirilowii]